MLLAFCVRDVSDDEPDEAPLDWGLLLTLKGTVKHVVSGLREPQPIPGQRRGS
ncbi:MAG: hypothetical protein YYHSYBAR_000421 [Candidatus Fervidibacter sacchari]